MSTSKEAGENIPMDVWIWLWASLVDELGPERAAELCGELKRRSHTANQSADCIGKEREVGASW